MVLVLVVAAAAAAAAAASAVACCCAASAVFVFTVVSIAVLISVCATIALTTTVVGSPGTTSVTETETSLWTDATVSVEAMSAAASAVRPGKASAIASDKASVPTTSFVAATVSPPANMFVMAVLNMLATSLTTPVESVVEIFSPPSDPSANGVDASRLTIPLKTSWNVCGPSCKFRLTGTVGSVFSLRFPPSTKSLLMVVSSTWAMNSGA